MTQKAKKTVIIHNINVRPIGQRVAFFFFFFSIIDKSISREREWEEGSPAERGDTTPPRGRGAKDRERAPK
jgi:hypothetical protein